MLEGSLAWGVRAPRRWLQAEPEGCAAEENLGKKSWGLSSLEAKA